MINNLLKQQNPAIVGIQPSDLCNPFDPQQPIFAEAHVPTPLGSEAQQAGTFSVCVPPEIADQVNYLACVDLLNTAPSTEVSIRTSDNSTDNSSHNYNSLIVTPAEQLLTAITSSSSTPVLTTVASPVSLQTSVPDTVLTNDSNHNCSSFNHSTTSSAVSTATTNPHSNNNNNSMPEQPPQSELIAFEKGYDGSEIQLHFNQNEQKIMEATLKAFESGSLTPLIKEELRCTIQSRRLAEGKGELQVEFKTPKKRKEMTDEERSRALKRRQQNREAAQRFRQRQKDTSDYLSAKIKRLEKNSNTLVKDLNRLKEERDELKRMLEDHLQVCTNHAHIPQTVGFDVDRFLQELSNPTSSLSSLPQAMPICPDTSDSSCSSVFFPDDGQDHISQGNEVVIQTTDDLSYMENVIEDLTVAPDICYEEIVVEIDHADTGSEYSDDQRLDSCSSMDTASNYGSVSSDPYSLSESTGALRHSLASAYSRVHMNSCSSERFETSFVEELLLTDDVTP